MFVVHVHIKVKVEHIEAFREATILNAQESIKEEGIVKFDILQQKDDPSSFILEEAYYTRDDQLKHRETQHFLKWRRTTQDMRVGPSKVVEYNPVS